MRRPRRSRTQGRARRMADLRRHFSVGRRRSVITIGCQICPTAALPSGGCSNPRPALDLHTLSTIALKTPQPWPPTRRGSPIALRPKPICHRDVSLLVRGEGDWVVDRPADRRTQGFHLTPDSFMKRLNRAATSACAQPIKQLVREQGPTISAANWSIGISGPTNISHRIRTRRW
jgi:hypothetical protein